MSDEIMNEDVATSEHLLAKMTLTEPNVEAVTRQIEQPTKVTDDHPVTKHWFVQTHWEPPRVITIERVEQPPQDTKDEPQPRTTGERFRYIQQAKCEGKKSEPSTDIFNWWLDLQDAVHKELAFLEAPMDVHTRISKGALSGRLYHITKEFHARAVNIFADWKEKYVILAFLYQPLYIPLDHTDAYLTSLCELSDWMVSRFYVQPLHVPRSIERLGA